jgi:Ala-tRNA(Pro) deacylase
MTFPKKLFDYLDQRKIHYTHSEHPRAYTAKEVARAEQTPAHMIAKVIVFLCEDGFGMAVLPGDRYVNLEELRLSLGVARLRLATEVELADLFNNCCEVGAMPPFGNGTLFELPVFVDASLASEAKIGFNAGTHRDVIWMRYADFVATVHPRVLHYAMALAY